MPSYRYKNDPFISKKRNPREIRVTGQIKSGRLIKLIGRIRGGSNAKSK